MLKIKTYKLFLLTLCFLSFSNFCFAYQSRYSRTKKPKIVYENNNKYLIANGQKRQIININKLRQQKKMDSRKKTNIFHWFKDYMKN